jgi:glutamate carboxypeptidase
MTGQPTRQILTALRSRQPEIEKFMQALVETESPSGDEEGSRAVVDLLVQAASALDCVSRVDRETVPGFGQHLVIRAFQQQSDAKQILLVGHTDTVHSRGSVSERPWRREAGKIYGPGIFDMKANCVLAIEVLRALSELKMTPAFAVTVVLFGARARVSHSRPFQVRGRHAQLFPAP